MKKKKKKYNIRTERVLPTPEFLKKHEVIEKQTNRACLLYTSPSPRDG